MKRRAKYYYEPLISIENKVKQMTTFSIILHEKGMQSTVMNHVIDISNYQQDNTKS